MAVGPPRHNARRASTVRVTGLAWANGCSQPGMVVIGTKVELVKISGTAPRMPASPADSGSRTSSPIRAFSQDKATPRAKVSKIRVKATGSATCSRWLKSSGAATAVTARCPTVAATTTSAHRGDRRTLPRAVIAAAARARAALPMPRLAYQATPLARSPARL